MAGNSSSCAPGDLQVALNNVALSETLITSRLSEEPSEENEVLSLTAMIVRVTGFFLYFVTGRTRPLMLQVPNGAQYWQQLTQEFLSNITTLHEALTNEGNRRGTQNLSENVSRPGCAINQPATLACPHCGTGVPVFIRARVSSALQRVTASIKVRVELQQPNPNGGPFKCPACQETARTKLILGGETNTGNIVNVRVVLDKESKCHKETADMINRVVMLLGQAATNVITAAEQGQPAVQDRFMVAIIIRHIQTAIMLLLSVRDGTFLLASWMNPGLDGGSLMDNTGQFLREKFPLIDPSSQRPEARVSK